MYSEALPPALRFAACSSSRIATGLVPGSIFASLPAHAKTPQHIATGNGIVMQASQAGQFLGPLALAWIATRFGGWDATCGHAGFAAGGVLCGIAIGANRGDCPGARIPPCPKSISAKSGPATGSRTPSPSCRPRPRKPGSAPWPRPASRRSKSARSCRPS